LSNAKGTAPGLYYRQDNKTFVAMPGVPYEMQSMFTEHLQTIFKDTYNCQPIYIEDIHTWNISESALAEKLSDLPIPSSVQLAWLPQTGRVDLRIYGSDRQAIDTIKSQITQKINEWIWGEAMDTPQSVLNELLLKHNYVISVAESCTGGLIQELLTSIPGASKIYKGGVIAYDNDVKMCQLKVSKETLDNYGAVSSDTAKEMALGIKNLFNSNIGLSVTGIAGPDGATPEKPIGLVYIGIAFGEQILAHKVVFNGDRNSIRHKAAEYSILTVIDMLKRSV
jgi:nicotinamide-nucleotide amidase